MIQTETTLDRIIAIIAKEGPLDCEPKPDQQLFYVAAMESSDQARDAGNYGLDSLDRVEIVMAIEDEFGFEIPDIDLEHNPNWNTAEGIAAYVDSRLEQERD